MRTRDLIKESTIREKAIELIVNEGFDGLSMHKVAKAANVSVATIYIYFKDREHLIQQLYQEELRKLTEAVLQNFDPNDDFDKGLRTQWVNRMNFYLNNPTGMTFMEQVKHSPFLDRTVADTRFLDVMKQFVKLSIERKQLIPLSFEIFWSIAYAPLYQLLKFHFSQKKSTVHPDFKLDEEKMNLSLSLVLKSLKP